MKLARWLVALAGMSSFSACVSYDVSDRIALAERIAAQHRFSRVDIRTSRFDLVSFVGPRTSGRVLRVYIEGDGLAWITRREPSRNPTPIDPVALKLAVLDGQDAVYLARPCQYTKSHLRECDSRYWTSARFAEDVIDAMDEAVSQTVKRLGAEKVVLIGYSGGGAIAALVAARRSDVANLITVGGNLDHQTWARLHAIPELHGSLNPVDYRLALGAIRQTHIVGEVDRVVPLEVYRAYRRSFPDDANIKVKIVPGLDHGCCWERVWPSLLKELE